MPDQPEGLVFEVSGRREGVPLAVFLAKTKGLLRALVALDRQMSEDHRNTVRWVIVQASYNSPLRLRVAPKPIRGRTPNRRITDTYVRGVKILEEGSGEPPYFTPAIMATTKKVLKTKSEAGGPIALYIPGEEAVQPSSHLARNVNRILRQKYYKEYTTLEGKLDSINIYQRREFSIYDALTDHPTRCHFDQEQYGEAYNGLGRRVAVTGWVTYNRQDDPVSMRVDEIRYLRDSAELPRFLEGEELDITGGEDSAEYVRRMRDAE